MESEAVRKGNHRVWQIHYHIMFPVKYRKALLDEEVVEILRQTAIAIQDRYEIEIEAIGTDEDDIHLLCGGHPKLSPGRIVQIFKSITAREIFLRKPSVKKELWGGEFWTDGYYMATVGERANWQTVGEICSKPGQGKRRSPTAAVAVIHTDTL